MTNLLEKALITGFGIFILVIFLSFIIPFFDQLNQYNEEEKDVVESYLEFISHMDSAIKSVNENPEEVNQSIIKYPEYLILNLNQTYAKFYFIIDGQNYTIIYEYARSFFPEYTIDNMGDFTYYLKITCISENIRVQFILY